MSNKCETVIISDKAYNAMIRESFAKHPVETGGILLGYILDNGMWVVMEMIPPGINGVFQTAYFEYDQDFVNYLGTSIANQYKEPLQVLGLWHRHPGSMDYFSATDDGTNSEFASKNPYGVISGLVNIDPAFRLTMYHLDHNNGIRPSNIAYSNVEVAVGDDLIPEKFFELRYVDRERSDLHPTPTQKNIRVAPSRDIPKSFRNESNNETEMSLETNRPKKHEVCILDSSKKKANIQKWLIPFIGVIILFLGIYIGIKAAPIFEPKPIKTEESDKPGDHNATPDMSATISGSESIKAKESDTPGDPGVKPDNTSDGRANTQTEQPSETQNIPNGQQKHLDSASGDETPDRQSNVSVINNERDHGNSGH